MILKDIKAKFPIFSNDKLVYLDSAATAQKPQAVIDSEVEYYTKYAANVHRGLYPISDMATIAYEKARENVAKFINAEPDEIIFTSGTTDGINFIAKALKESELINDKPKVLLTELEHHSNIVPWQMIGAEKIEYIPLNEKLELDLGDALEDRKLKSFDVVSLSLASNVTGHVANIKEISDKLDYTYLVIDAAQAAPHIPIDVKELGVDFLVFSGHKLYGPTGIGVIYAKKEILEKLIPYRTGGGMIREVFRDRTTFSDLPEKFEAGTPNIAGAIGMSASVDFVRAIGFEAIQSHENELREYALEKIMSIEGLKVFHAGSKNSSETKLHLDLKKELDSIGVISFAHPKIHAHDIAQFLGDQNICIRAGHHCTQILHRGVLKVPATARISLGVYSTKEDIDKFIEMLIECIKFYS